MFCIFILWKNSVQKTFIQIRWLIENSVKIGPMNPILMAVHTILSILFHLLPYLHWIPYNRSALNAVELLWVSWKSAQRIPHFTYRRKWNYIYAYTVKPYTYFQSRPKERLGEVCVPSHGVAFEIVLQDGAVLRNFIILNWKLRLR